MFWGLAIEPGKRYMQTVSNSFHLSMACLELNNHDNEPLSLMLDYENQEYVLCNLQRQKVMQCQLDLNFQAGEKIAFYSIGKSRVHLSGYLVEEDDTELTDDDFDEEDEEEMSPAKSPAKKRKDGPPDVLSSKKLKMDVADDSDDNDDDIDDTFQDLKDDDEDDDDDVEEEDDDDDDDEEEEEEEDDSDEKQTPVKNLNKSQNKIQSEKQKKNQGVSPKTPTQNGQTPQSGKKNKNKQGGETPKSEGEGGTPQKRVLAGGVLVQDVKVGNGPVAKAGRQVTVYYVGKLKQNNKQFDATTSGPGFKFSLGRSEVIKGWDVGVAGMKVGGKRTITVPPQMAYGKKGQPPVIPPNSTLVFDVELRSTN